MELELVDHGQGVVLGVVEVGAVHVVLGRHVESILPVPVVVLSGEVLARDEFGVEHRIRGPVLPVGLVDGLEDSVDELVVLGIGADGQSEEFGRIRQAVDADSQVLPLHVDEAGGIDVQHPGGKEVLYDLIEGVLVLVHPLGLFRDRTPDVVIELVLVIVTP